VIMEAKFPAVGILVGLIHASKVTAKLMPSEFELAIDT
jgi:hypothetical protein